MNDDFENLETRAPLPDPEAELKAIRRNLRRRNLKIVLTSVVLVLAILAGAVKFVIPALEKQYWDPTVCTYLEDVTDLELTMAAYNELFSHGKHFEYVDIQKRGFADYSLNAIFAERKTIISVGNLHYRSASLTKGELLCPPNFWSEPIAPGTFVWSITPETTAQYRALDSQAKQALEALPDYVQVYASVTFSKDMSLGRLQQLTFQYLPEDGRFIWAILRSGDAADSPDTSCGVPIMGNITRYSSSFGDDTAYPQLFVDPYFCTGKDLEQHVKSMLKFSADQLQKGEGILPPGDDPDYYTKTLNYMEANGVKAYGSYIIATPRTLLKLIEGGVVAHIRLLDARIGI